MAILVDDDVFKEHIEYLKSGIGALMKQGDNEALEQVKARNLDYFITDKPSSGIKYIQRLFEVLELNGGDKKFLKQILSDYGDSPMGNAEIPEKTH